MPSFLTGPGAPRFRSGRPRGSSHPHGPFYRSLLRHQSADGDGLHEILYYGENQTESERYGLQGPYVIAFTDGGAPSSTLYHGALSTQVTVSAGTTTTLNTITVPSSDDPSNASAIWRTGNGDGTPSGFKNADLMTYAHPSDVRAASWTRKTTTPSATTSRRARGARTPASTTCSRSTW